MLLLRSILCACVVCAGVTGELPATAPQVVRFTTSVGLEFQYIPAGTFTMGGNSYFATPRHQVTMSHFYVARDVLPKRTFRRFLTETKRQGNRDELGPDPAGWTFESQDQWDKLSAQFTLGAPTEQHSIHGQSLDDARAFAAWLSEKESRRFQVITEAQYEYIARCGIANGDEEHWWAVEQPGALGNWTYDSYWVDSSVGLGGGSISRHYTMNAWGIYIDNKAVWARDRYAKYPDDPQSDPTGPLLTVDGFYVRRGVNIANRSKGKPEQPLAGILLVADVTPADYRQAAKPDAAMQSVMEPVQSLPEQSLDLAAGVRLAVRQIPTARYILGRPQRERPWTREWPETEMNLGPYWLGTTEVTQAQFQAVTGMNTSLVKGDSLPVHSVIMPEMLAFCDLVTARERAAGRLGADEEYRLPTEAEWEQAALAGRRSRFAHGDDEKQLADHAWFDVLGGPRPVATKNPNRWGFYDMEGNILEIMCEHMFLYPGTPQNQHWTPRTRGGGGQTGWYAARGGAWNMGAVACEPTLRRAVHADSRTYFMGFRLARGPVLPEWQPGWTPGKPSSPWIFIFAPYRASKAYAAVMQSAPASWPRPAGWKPPEKSEVAPQK